MRRLNLITLSVLWLLLIAAAACASTPTTAPAVPAAPAATPTPESEPTEEAVIDVVNRLEEFDPNNFDDPTNIDNPWYSLKPGTRWAYDGHIEDSGLIIPHRIVFTVTDLTKEIEGVRTVVALVEDYTKKELVEAELAFYAQDNDGNVWYMGEYPEEYENGEFVDAPAWIAGLKGARAGIKMKAEPQEGSPSYSQGWGPAVNWTDYGQVDEMGLENCVPLACYQDVLVIAESSLNEQDAFQLKYYTRGVGEIRVGWRGADANRETLELVELIQLDPEALAEVRTKAFALELSGFKRSKEVYAKTQLSVAPDGSTINIPAPEEALKTKPEAMPVPTEEIVIYASDLAEEDVSELEFWDDPASPGGVMIGLTNTGDELDAPPENDPHASFEWVVQKGGPYRCWIHMKVGAPMGKSQANRIYLQFSGTVDGANQIILEPRSNSFLTAQGPAQEGWAWVGCDLEGTDSLFYFTNDSESTIRIQAGMEGVGFDQLVLSPARYLEEPPSEPVVDK